MLQKQLNCFCLIVLLLAQLILSGCGQSPGAATTTTQRPDIALILPGSKDDNSWSAAAYRALQSEAALGARTAYAEAVDDAKVALVLQSFIDQGFKIIIAHSYSYQDTVFALAAQYPTVHFAWPGGIGRTAPNVADYDPPFYEAAYLVGILAGSISQSGRLGALYGFDIPVCHAMGEALLAGARKINPLVRLVIAETGDWHDSAGATTAGVAQAQQQGVDFWLACGEGPTWGSIAAARATGGVATGYASDMAEIAPDVVLTSIVWQMTPLFHTIVQTTMAGSFQGTFYRFGMKEGAVTVAINPAFHKRLPQAAQQAFRQAQLAIKQGTLQVPYIPR